MLPDGWSPERPSDRVATLRPGTGNFAWTGGNLNVEQEATLRGIGIQRKGRGQLFLGMAVCNLFAARVGCEFLFNTNCAVIRNSHPIGISPFAFRYSSSVFQSGSVCEARFAPRNVPRQMEWTPPPLMFDVRGIKWTLAGRRHHSAQVGSIRFPGKPEGPR